MTIVKIKVFYGSKYTRCKNISIDRNELTQMTFIMFSCKVKQILCQEKSSMRIQYKDDEQTFVTMTCNEDFEDALRCVEPIPSYDGAYRLTIKIDDSLTPTLKSPAKKKPCIIINYQQRQQALKLKVRTQISRIQKVKRDLIFTKMNSNLLNMNLRAIKKLSNTKRLYRGTSLLVKPKSTLN